jgi:hypothetical protein
VVQVRESLDVCGVVSVKESKLDRVPVKIIGPGWGSSAYYSESVLKRAVADGIWSSGQHMMFNHTSESELVDRPEGDINNLAGVLTVNAVWKDSGPKGPGVYSEAKVFSDYAQQVEDKGAHIGVSINAAIRSHEGEAAGKRGQIADKFIHSFSTDFVTVAGAGGAPIVPVQEAARPLQQEVKGMTVEEQKQMDDLRDRALKAEESARALQGRQNAVVAMGVVSKTLREASIGFSAHLLELACADPKMKGSEIDADWLQGVVEAFSSTEHGRVTGLGRQTGGGDGQKALRESLKANLKRLGVADAALEAAAGGGY